MRVARYRVAPDGSMERLIFQVNDISEVPEGWFVGEFEARQAAAAPAPQADSAPAASKPRRGKK